MTHKNQRVKTIVFGVTAALIIAFVSCKHKSDVENPKAVTGVKLSETVLDIEEGSDKRLIAEVIPANAANKKVKWESDKPGIASVAQDGTVTAVALGEAKITVTTEDGGKKAFCTVTVRAKPVSVTSVSLDTTTFSLEQGEAKKFAVSIEPANASNKNVSWESDKPDIASVSKDGIVTALALGEAKITVTTEDGGKQAVCTVIVTAETMPSMHTAIFIVNPDKKDIKIAAITSDGNPLTVKGCKETSLESGKETVLHAEKDRVILEGDITSLVCEDNKFTGIKVRGLISLQTLICNSNNLASLNVQGLTSLEILKCQYNRIKTLDVQSLTSLKTLWCEGNGLTDLNVKGLASLERLECHYNMLEALDIQGLTSLKELHCYGNKFEQTFFTKLFADLPSRPADSKGEITLYTEQYGEENYKEFTDAELKTVKDKNWKTYKRNSNWVKKEL